MNTIIEQLRSASPTIQALGVSAGGLLGVFITLALFFIITWVAIRIGNRG